MTGNARAPTLRRLATPLCLALALTSWSPASSVAAEGTSSLEFTTAVDYSSGDYGTGNDTDILYVPFSVKYRVDPWAFGLSLPYIQITGNGDVVGGSGTPIVVGSGGGGGGGGGARTTNSGLGDVLASVAYSVYPGSNWVVDLIGEIKIPTADETEGLGTGKFDYAVSTDIATTVGRWSPFATLGYRFLGNTGAAGLNNTAFASVGGTFELGKTWSAGAALDYSQASSDAGADSIEFSPFLTWTVTGRLGLNLYAVLGLSDGSPDTGGGLQLTLRL